MVLVGLRLDDHDSNICVYNNGNISYLKSERRYQIKHFAYNNNNQWVIDLKRFFDLTPDDIDEIAIIADPLRYGIDQFFDFTSKEYTGLADTVCPVFHLEHHLAHAYSAWMHEDTDYQFVFDGVGELFQNQDIVKGTNWSVFKNYKLIDRNTCKFDPISETAIRVNNSFGVEYENLGHHVDVTASHPEDIPGKLMSLQSFGSVDYKFIDYLNARLDDVKNQLTIACHPGNWTDYLGSQKIAELRKLDFVATIHKFLEQQLLNIIRTYADPNDKILITGGCAQNICWNTNIKNEFPNAVFTPHCADDGLALGAVEWLRQKNQLDKLSISNFPFCQADESPDTIPDNITIKTIAQDLANGKIVAWYQNQGEIGPRALGNRSILINPMLKDAKEILNNKVKHREDYRPFGATILKEYQNEYFDIDYDNPYMLFIGKLKKDIPSISHVDGTCRFQTLGQENLIYRQLIEEFYKITGLPLILNTSLNKGGKPIAGCKRDALEILHETEIDVLVYGNEIIRKHDG